MFTFAFGLEPRAGARAIILYWSIFLYLEIFEKTAFFSRISKWAKTTGLILFTPRTFYPSNLLPFWYFLHKQRNSEPFTPRTFPPPAVFNHLSEMLFPSLFSTNRKQGEGGRFGYPLIARRSLADFARSKWPETCAISRYAPPPRSVNRAGGQTQISADRIFASQFKKFLNSSKCSAGRKFVF